MYCRAATLLTLAVAWVSPVAAHGRFSVLREPMPSGLELTLAADRDALRLTWFEQQVMPECELEPTASPFAAEVSWEDELRWRAESLPRVPTVVEQWGADIEYCPEYLPELYPERTLGQMCEDSLMGSLFLEQGTEGTNFFRVADSEAFLMQRDTEKIARKIALAGVHYWLHRDSPNAIDGAVRTFVSEETPGLWNSITNAVAPRVLDLLPSEISGLPPPDEFGTAIDLRVNTSATWKSVGDPDTMLRRAAERGLEGIVVTDADHVAGHRQVVETADRLKREGVLPAGFLVIKGQEVTTLGGELIAIFVEDRVPRNMTMRAAIRDIHRQGGFAILADPGSGSGTKLVQTMPVDGYLLRTRPESVYRTLELMGDMTLLDKPLLSASGARSGGMVGIPYSAMEPAGVSAGGFRRALANREVFGATGIQMPILAVMVSRPWVSVERRLARWFSVRDDAERVVEGWIGSDNVEIRTSYDDQVEGLMSVVNAPNIVEDLLDGSSPLTRLPDITRISADYSYVRVEWDRERDTVMVKGAVRW